MDTHGIQQFYSAAVKHQFMRDFNFRVMSINTKALTINGSDSSELVYVIADTLPGREIYNVQQPFMGLKFNIAGTASYPGSDAYQITFFVDAAGLIRQKLERASRYIFNDQYSTGDYRLAGPDEHIVLATVGPDLKKLTTYTLVGAQFRNISPMKFDYLDGHGELMKCECTVAFQYYTVSDSSSSLSVSYTNGSNNQAIATSTTTSSFAAVTPGK